MAKYEKYAEYKESGVEWLGEIPSHWTVTRLKFLAKIKNGQDYKHVEAECGFPVMGSGGQFTFSTQFMFDKPSISCFIVSSMKAVLKNCGFHVISYFLFFQERQPVKAFPQTSQKPRNTPRRIKRNLT